tara:strand:+ start:2505 stop:5762 length:3258 start_codon:yes stop_codon:yes gene_type:complete
MSMLKASFCFLIIIVAFIALFISSVTNVYAQEEAPGPDFRIIDIRAEYGHMIVETQHFNMDGTHWFYELYTFQGRQEFDRRPITDAGNRLFIQSTGLEAPKRLDITGQLRYYLPPGETWLTGSETYLDENYVTSAISHIHQQRLISGWDKGFQRLTVYPLNPSVADITGQGLLAKRMEGLKQTSYYQGLNDNVIEYHGLWAPVDPYISKQWGTVSTITSSQFGNVGRGDLGNPGETWLTIRNSAGMYATNNSTEYTGTNLYATSTSNQYRNLDRGITVFDTSTLPSTASVSAANFEVVIKNNGGCQTALGLSISIVDANPASQTAFVAADYSTLGTTKQSDTTTAYGSLTCDSVTFNAFPLNATGIGNIAIGGGNTVLGQRTEIDRTGASPSWVSNTNNWTSFNGSAGYKPRMVITYVAPSAAITGNIGDGATEQEVRDGGGTILVTLTDDTWVATGATFDAQRQAIIDGLDAATTPSNGWNDEVRDEIGVASVVRTSDTLVTITLVASEVADYRITSTETITVTVPASAVASGSAITATPTITITPGTESAAITGTIGDGATEQEVRDGGGTILITLSDTNWVPSAASEFDNQRQNIINGLVAADSQTYGWNNEVKAKLGVGAVVRTSDTLVTITIPAGDVEDYRIVTNEVITTTIPASALVYGAALVATPTTTITGSVESASVTGTLGGSGGTAAEIEAGGETVIITLTNTTWVSAGATFNAQRQNILNGLVADDSDINGWNAMAFAVGDVVRTSGTIVTITLSAESGYAIPSSETVTTTVPASAMVYGGSLVAPETFTITPSAFVTSGTRVSTAIDLSNITNLAYCAIGWEATLPTNTSAAIETSVDGGSNYSTATSGNCPIGLTVGESLATITDFRVKATLTTTDTSTTPLITALGLILEDAGGAELCYQLVTTPSASLTDNCGTYTGTMSYPIGPSTITSSTAPIASTVPSFPNTRSLAGQDVAQAVTGSATSAKLFPDASEGGGFTGLPLNDLVNEMSTVGDGLPVRFVWFIFLGIATIGAGMMAVHLTSNLFIAAGAMAAVMGFQMAIGTTGLLPGWILFAFIPLAAAYLLFRRGFPA